MRAGEEGFADFLLGLALLGGQQVLADAGFEGGEVFVVAEFVGEFVVQLGQVALLDGLDFEVVGDGLAGELGFGVVGGVDGFDLELLADLGAAESFGEGGEGFGAADFDE